MQIIPKPSDMRTLGRANNSPVGLLLEERRIHIPRQTIQEASASWQEVTLGSLFTVGTSAEDNVGADF